MARPVRAVSNHDADAFLASLEASYESRDFWMVQLRTEPVYDPFRADPRLEEMARRVRNPGGPD